MGVSPNTIIQLHYITALNRTDSSENVRWTFLGRGQLPHGKKSAHKAFRHTPEILFYEFNSEAINGLATLNRVIGNLLIKPSGIRLKFFFMNSILKQ
jgi:hypothetical protein